MANLLYLLIRDDKKYCICPDIIVAKLVSAISKKIHIDPHHIKHKCVNKQIVDVSEQVRNNLLLITYHVALQCPSLFKYFHACRRRRIFFNCIQTFSLEAINQRLQCLYLFSVMRQAGTQPKSGID